MQQSGVKALQPPSLSLGQKFPHKNKDLQRTQTNSMIMNERNLQIICENEGLYEYPQMNSKIYLHFKVIQKIQSLQKYINLKTLYLQNNVITKIQNLQCLPHLQTLFLQNNMIKKIQNLQKNKKLIIVNLSNNNIFKIQGLSQLCHLQNLNLSHNYLKQFQDLQHLGECTTQLTAIDLSSNQIKPNIQLLNLIPQVKCLYLINNPLVREIKHYRRVIVGTLKNLLYLDQRGIDNQERILANAYVQGGDHQYNNAKLKVHQIRQKHKQQKKQDIMKDIDVHRNRKIQIFRQNITQSEQQIQKLRSYMTEKGNQDMIYYWESKVAQLYQKIRQNQEFINNINKRIGAKATSISSGNSIQSQKSLDSDGNKSEPNQISQKSIPEDNTQFDDLSDQNKDQLTQVNMNQQQISQQKIRIQKLTEQGSELSFSQTQQIPKFQAKLSENKIPIKLVPAECSGLDQLD